MLTQTYSVIFQRSSSYEEDNGWARTRGQVQVNPGSGNLFWDLEFIFLWALTAVTRNYLTQSTITRIYLLDNDAESYTSSINAARLP